MRIPKIFHIENFSWPVSYKWNLRYGKTKVDGLCEFDKTQVLIERSSEREEKFWIFVHEFLHATLHSYDVGQRASKRALTHDQEEHIVSAIEKELRANFKMNWKHKR